ncbi:hypothetical protein ACOMHN_063740 [Nucella lapillus]
MSQDESTFSLNQSYNNRFRTSRSGGEVPSSDQQVSPAPDCHQNVSRQSSTLSHPSLQGRVSLDHTAQPSQPPRTSTSQDQPPKCSQVIGGDVNFPETSPDAGQANTGEQNVEDSVVSKPTAPGHPRRLSRQISAGTKRQNFAACRSVSGDGRGKSTSLESNRDDVFLALDVEGAASQEHPRHHVLYDSSMFTSNTYRQKILSTTSSTASSQPNPYNRLNHHVHDAVWFCNCLFFVFFCCLPAVHFMEQSDVHHQLNDHKKARRLGTLSTVLFAVGALLTLVFFALIFFLVIYFTTR